MGGATGLACLLGIQGFDAAIDGGRYGGGDGDGGGLVGGVYVGALFVNHVEGGAVVMGQGDDHVDGSVQREEPIHRGDNGVDVNCGLSGGHDDGRGPEFTGGQLGGDALSEGVEFRVVGDEVALVQDHDLRGRGGVDVAEDFEHMRGLFGGIGGGGIDDVQENDGFVDFFERGAEGFDKGRGQASNEADGIA